MMSDGRCFFGRQRLAFFAALNCACLAASMVVLTGAATAGAARLVHTTGEPTTDADAPSVRVSAALCTKAAMAAGERGDKESKEGEDASRGADGCKGSAR